MYKIYCTACNFSTKAAYQARERDLAIAWPARPAGLSASYRRRRSAADPRECGSSDFADPCNRLDFTQRLY